MCDLTPCPRALYSAEVADFATELRGAVVRGVMNTEKLWQEKGHYAGTTMTAAIITGNLLTIANVGDSQAMVDTGEPLGERTAARFALAHSRLGAAVRAAAQR